jgi:hypothetical protein
LEEKQNGSGLSPGAERARGDMKTHRVLLVIMLVALVVGAHALGAVAVAEVGSGGVAYGQPVTFAVVGLVLVAAVAKVTHLVAFGAFGAGFLSLRQLLSKLRGSAGRPPHAKIDGQ